MRSLPPTRLLRSVSLHRLAALAALLVASLASIATSRPAWDVAGSAPPLLALLEAARPELGFRYRVHFRSRPDYKGPVRWIVDGEGSATWTPAEPVESPASDPDGGAVDPGDGGATPPSPPRLVYTLRFLDDLGDAKPILLRPGQAIDLYRTVYGSTEVEGGEVTREVELRLRLEEPGAGTVEVRHELSVRIEGDDEGQPEGAAVQIEVDAAP